MRCGVITLTSSISKEADHICASLQAKGIPVLQCSQDDVSEADVITDFIAVNRLETVVISNLGQTSPPESLRYAIEEAGLGRLAVNWIDLVPLLGEQLSVGSTDSATMTVLVNAARLQHADYIRRAVLRTVRDTSTVSRRELFGSLPRVLKVESNIPIVLDNRCKDRSRSCDYCRRACPVNAVSQTGDTVTIDDRLCIECGACARECPMGAIQSPSISDVQLIAMLNALASQEFGPQGRALMLTCPIGFAGLLDESRQGKHLGSGIVPVQVPCVASIGSVHHLWSASLGVTLVTVCPDVSCSKAVAMFPMYQHATSSKSILETLGKDRAITVHHVALNANESIIDSISRTITLVSPIDKSAGLSGVTRRGAMLDALRTLRTGSGARGGLFVDHTLPLFDLKVDDARCTFCESCRRDCPDQAIAFTTSEDALTLIFDPALCGGCMICEKNCPEKAIALSKLGDLSIVLENKKEEKAQDENAKCENCGTSLGSKRSLTLLRKRFSEQGVADATLRATGLCNRCKQHALIAPHGRHIQM